MKLNESILRNLKEAEERLVTVDNDPAWAAAVAKVNKEFEENKPEMIQELKAEYKEYIKGCLDDGYTKEEIAELPVTKAYKDAMKDPDDIWCECDEYPDETLFKDDGEIYLGVSKHAWICPNCGKFTQIG